MSKKILTIIILLIVVIGTGSYAYYKLFIKQGTQTPSGSTENNFWTGLFPTSNQNSSSTITTQTNSAIKENPETNTETPSSLKIEDSSQNLVQLTKEPISGFLIAPNTSTTNPMVMYTEKKSGHIFNINLSSYIQTRISNTTMPNITEAVFSPKGDRIVYRSIKKNSEDIDSYSFKLSPNGIESGIYLAQNINSLSFSPNDSRIIYLNSDSAIVIENNDTKKSSVVFQSEFSDWNISWPNETTITLTTKSSKGIPGFLYFLNPTTKAMKSVASNVKGLTTLTNPSASYALLSDDSNLLYSIDTKTSKISNLGLFTRAEKCVWSKLEKSTAYCAGSKEILSGNFPDDWYQGLFSFRDNLYKINASSGTSTLVSDIPSEYAEGLDMINLALNPKETYLIFKNKTDETLWSMKLP